MLILKGFCLVVFFGNDIKTINLVVAKIMLLYMFPVWLYLIRTKRSRGIEQNPGPNYCPSFSICNWNLDSILVQNFIKLLLSRVYITIPKRYYHNAIILMLASQMT